MSDTTQPASDTQQHEKTVSTKASLDYKCERVEVEGGISIDKLWALSNSQAPVQHSNQNDN